MLAGFILIILNDDWGLPSYAVLSSGANFLLSSWSDGVVPLIEAIIDCPSGCSIILESDVYVYNIELKKTVALTLKTGVSLSNVCNNIKT